MNAALAPLAAEPSWTFPGPAAPDRAAAGRLLATLRPEDRQTLLLSHGCGLPLGDVAYALGLDPSIVAWRVRRALADPAGAQHAAGVERGLAALLRERVESGGADSELAPATLARLAARRAGETGAAGTRGGALGVGSLLLIVVAALGFMVYGVIRDVNPLWRGREKVRRGDFAGARQDFIEVGRQPEARAWLAFCYLADGQFDKALEVLREPEVAQYLPNAFRPVDQPLESVGEDLESPALLPRGLLSITRPTFVFRPTAAGAVTLQLTSTALGTDKPRDVHWKVDDTTTKTPVAVFGYPTDAPDLPPGTVVWWPPGGDDRPVSFTIVSKEQQANLRVDLERVTADIPVTAREFLRGEFFLHHQLYVQAGEQFSRLAHQFPDQPWPRQVVAEVAAALGVDPAAFLR